jgi:hypothetical protein
MARALRFQGEGKLRAHKPMDRLRTPFLLLAILLSLFVVALETGTALPGVLRANSLPLTSFQLPAQLSQDVANLNSDQQAILAQVQKQDRPPGLGIPDMALLDSIVLFTLALMGVALILPARLQGKIQGIVTLIFAILLIILALAQIFFALASLILMIALFFAFPFGTIIYLIIYGSFNRAGADAVLNIIMLLKIGIALCLAFAQQRFFQGKGLVLLLLTSLVATLIVNFLLGLVPGVLVSITDAIAALIVGIIAVIWAIILLIGSLISLVKVLRLDRALKKSKVTAQVEKGAQA